MQENYKEKLSDAKFLTVILTLMLRTRIIESVEVEEVFKLVRSFLLVCERYCL